MRPHETKPLKLVGDGAISTPGVDDGRVIPVLIVDTSNRADIIEYVRIHEENESGDVSTQWGKRWYGPTIYLHIRSIRPLEMNILIEIHADKNASLINLILKAQAFYLQPGLPGDRLGKDIAHPKVLIGAPDTGFAERWRNEYQARITKRFKKGGMNTADAKRAAENYIMQMNLLENWKPPRK